MYNSTFLKNMLLKYITVASAFNFLIIALVLLFKRVPHQKANGIMGFFLLIMAIYSSLVSFRFTVLMEEHYSSLNHYLPVDGILMLLLAPSLYLYIQAILNKPVSILQWKMLVHLIPTIPFLIFNLYFSTLPQHERIEWFIVDFTHGTWETNLLNLVLYVQMPVYLFMCYSLIMKQLKVSPIVIVKNMRMDISWLRMFIIMNIAFIFLSAGPCFYFANEKANIIIGQLAMNIQFFYIFFKSVWQKNIFSTAEAYEAPRSNDPVLKVDDSTADCLLMKLELHMKHYKPYLDENCNIQLISEQTGMPAYQLSNIINTRLKKSFSEYVNEYRVNESKMMLSSDAFTKLKLEAIGFECGFGSKSSFNKTFKRHTNLTPTEFRQSCRAETNTVSI